jgi:hypothetical protein
LLKPASTLVALHSRCLFSLSFVIISSLMCVNLLGSAPACSKPARRFASQQFGWIFIGLWLLLTQAQPNSIGFCIQPYGSLKGGGRGYRHVFSLRTLDNNCCFHWYTNSNLLLFVACITN